MRLTKRLALEICLKLWMWLARTGGYKEDWPGWWEVGRMRSYCPCCEYKWRHRNDCSRCLLRALWPKGCWPDSIYTAWFRAATPAARRKCARVIVHGIERELAKYKKGGER